MEDVIRHVNERKETIKEPLSKRFESEHQKAKNALVRQLDDLDGSDIVMIEAMTNGNQDDGRKLRVAAYCRVSTDDIDQKVSITLQRKAYEEMIKANPNWKYAGTYVDDGFSGTNTEHRLGFKKLMQDALDGKFDMIITKAVSRFARNLMDCIVWVQALQNHNPPVKVFFEQEHLYTGAQTSTMVLIVLAMVAEEESHMKSEAMLLSLEWRFSRGRFLTPELLGYEKELVPDGFGGYKKQLRIVEQQANVVRWLYYNIINGQKPEKLAEILTKLAVPTGGRRKNGTWNTHWSAQGICHLLRNERYCGDVLARKTFTPNYKDHKSRKNTGQKNKYYKADHHEAIVDRATWNATQRILNSRRYKYKGKYQPMKVIMEGALAGFISMNLRWAGYEVEDYFRSAQQAMGLVEPEDYDLSKEYLPDEGHKIGTTVDDQGIMQIARQLSEAEQKVKDELEGRNNDLDADENSRNEEFHFQVVRAEMFSRFGDPVMTIAPEGIGFNSYCIPKLEYDYVEILYNPIESMIVVRPSEKKNPNAVSWKAGNRGSRAIADLIYKSLGWSTEFRFKIPCQVISQFRTDILAFDLYNWTAIKISKGGGKEQLEEVSIDGHATEQIDLDDNTRSYYFPPEEDEPQEIKETDKQRQEALKRKCRHFGVAAYMRDVEFRNTAQTLKLDNWDLSADVVAMDQTHEVEQRVIDELFEKIKSDPPIIREKYGDYVEAEGGEENDLVKESCEKQTIV